MRPQQIISPRPNVSALKHSVVLFHKTSPFHTVSQRTRTICQPFNTVSNATRTMSLLLKTEQKIPEEVITTRLNSDDYTVETVQSLPDITPNDSFAPCPTQRTHTKLISRRYCPTNRRNYRQNPKNETWNPQKENN